MDNIAPLVQRIFAVTGENTEIVFVDDGSRDGTPGAVQKLARTLPIRLIERKNAGDGLAGAVLAGARAAVGATVVVMDADLSHPPEDIPSLVAPITEGTADLVIGSRFAQGGVTPGWPLKRRVVSRLASAVAWPLTDVQDSLSGFFAIRRELLLEIPEGAAGFKITLELLVRGGETLRVVEVPIVFRDRTHGASKMGPDVILTYFKRLFALSGGRTPAVGINRLFLASLLPWFIDGALFLFLVNSGIVPGSAHIGSFVAAAIVHRWTSRVLIPGPQGSAWRELVVAVLGVFLRGGVLALLHRSWGLPVAWSVLPLILSSAVVEYLGFAFFIAPVRDRYGPGIRGRVTALFLVTYLVILRLLYLGQPDLFPEEAYYWNYAQHLSLGYLDHPPMVAWLIFLGTSIFGQNAFGVRIGAVLCWAVASFFGYHLARSFYGKSAGIRTVVLMQLLPFYFTTGFMMTPDVPLVACWAATTYFLHRALLHESTHAWWGVGIGLGLGLLSKYSIGLLGVAALVFIISDRRARRWLWHPVPYGAVLLSVLLFSPVLIWNALNEWASFAFQGPRRLKAKSEFALHTLIASIAALLSPTGMLAAARALRSNPNSDESAEVPETNRRRRFIVIFTVTPLAVFVLFSLTHPPQLNWTGPLWIVLLPTIAYAAGRRSKSLTTKVDRWLHAAWVPTFVTLTVVYGAFLHYLALGLPGLGYSTRIELLPVGWSELGDRVGQLSRELQEKSGAVPLVAGTDKYFTASELAFYHGGRPSAVQNTAGANLFGNQGLMYEYWFPSELQEGRTILMVSFERASLVRNSLQKRFKRCGPLHEESLIRNGHLICRFYYRAGYGYRGGRAK